MARKNYVVLPERGLNLRELPTKLSPIIKVFKHGEKVVVDNNTDAPDGWKAVEGGGFVMAEFLK